MQYQRRNTGRAIFAGFARYSWVASRKQLKLTGSGLLNRLNNIVCISHLQTFTLGSTE
ncbi:hypothetical protein [Enterococcus sp.]|uniref:hypothetical protein n=1 Tax=Enterococcus sp. TaxID=35783 RepID=UPI00399182AC